MVICGVCCCYALHPDEFSPCKLRAPDLRLILDYFRTQFFETTSPTCWASLGVVVGNSSVLCGVCCCYALHPNEFSPCKLRATDLRLILDNFRTQLFEPTSPNCWASLGVVGGNSLVLFGVCCCYALHPDELSPCKPRAPDPQLILHYFKTQMFETTSPACWASLGVVVGNSSVICGVYCFYALHPN